MKYLILELTSQSTCCMARPWGNSLHFVGMKCSSRHTFAPLPPPIDLTFCAPLICVYVSWSPREAHDCSQPTERVGSTPFPSLSVRCLTFADCRLQTADSRLQTTDCRLQTTDRPPTLRGHVTSFLWKWKLHDFAFEKLLVGHLLNKIIVIFFKPAPFAWMRKTVAGHVAKTF